MGIELHLPAFVMKIKNIEDGSPAAATGKLKPGQVIESINGQKLADIDPRIQLAQILAKAEAIDGVMKFAIKGESQAVVVKVPVLGAYSKTWPLNCPKSDRIVRDLADFLSKPDSPKGIAGIGMLFLLSTGENKDLEVVRQWARKAPPHSYAWHLGFGGIPLTECYLRTGDKEILANIQKWVDNAVKGQYLDGWAGRGGVPSVTYGNGHLNAAGTSVVTFLLLARECGADVPDHALHGALSHFYRYAGRGGNPYGDSRPEHGFVDNGKNGNLAFAMAAAAALTPNGEQSVYAGARDVLAMTSFYTTTFMLHGHTGGGIGEIWRSAAMGLLHDEKPKQYREFMDNRQWHYDMSRRFNGSFGILGGGGYDTDRKHGGWGQAYAMAYTIPRKTLRISGAPPTKHSKQYRLPVRPWGTAEDDAFVSTEPISDANGKRPDFSNETLANDSGRPALIRLTRKGIPDEELRKYALHPDNEIRRIAVRKAMGINSHYLGRGGGGDKIRPELIHEFLQSKDARLRHAAYDAVVARLSGDALAKFLEPKGVERVFELLRDEKESWWIKDTLLILVSKLPADTIVEEVDLIIPFLKHEEWWFRSAALQALTPVIADERCYKKVLPPVGELVRTNQRSAVTLGLKSGIRAKIKAGSPAVHELARKTLKETYTRYAGVKTARGGQNISSVFDSHIRYIAGSIADVPGGLDLLYEVCRQRYPDQILPHKEFFLNADPSKFGPQLKKAIAPIIREELIPEFVGRNRKNLRLLAAAEIQSGRPGGSRDAIDGLAALHKRAGQDEFSWRIFMDLRNAEWSYHSFDPIAAEDVPFDQIITRFRKVTLPKGMETWYAANFNPSTAGWSKARGPFGNYNGKLPTRPITKCGGGCVGPTCFGATKVNTLWPKEVLLMRGTFKVPPIKDGHRYRLSVNDGNHVGAGGGHIVYINGKQLIEQKVGNGRGSGGLPKGAYITKEFLSDFRSGNVTIAVKTFLRFNSKYKSKPTSRTPQGKISIHLDEQKLPPIGDDLVTKSATVVPMLSSKWQSMQDPEDREKSDAAEKYRYDGKFNLNAKVLGSWNVITEVATIGDFDPSLKRQRGARSPYKNMTFNDDGKTNDAMWIWTGDMLLGLDKYQALKMIPKTLEGTEYLFVEAGGFNARNKPGWKSKLYVLKRK